MSEEISLVRFNILNFFSVMMNSKPFSPTTTILLKIVQSLITAEPEPDKKNLDRVNWIYENTHENVNVPLPIVELATFKNINSGLNREIEIYGKTFNLTQLYKYLDKISLELSKIVVETGKKYSIDIPIFNTFNKTGNINI